MDGWRMGDGGWKSRRKREENTNGKRRRKGGKGKRRKPSEDEREEAMAVPGRIEQENGLETREREGEKGRGEQTVRRGGKGADCWMEGRVN